MKAKVFDAKGAKKNDIALDGLIFDVKGDDSLLKQAVLRHLGNKREATSKTKTRAERSGGGRKPWRQKGTGRARTGSNRNPIWRKGGVTFGPTGEQSYKSRMNKKTLRLAIKMALTKKAQDDRVILVEKIDIEKPKTKDLHALIAKLPVEKRIMIVSEENAILYKTCENLKDVSFSLFNQLNPYNVLVSDYIIFTDEGYKKAVALYKNTERFQKKEEKQGKAEVEKKKTVKKESSNVPAKAKKEVSK